MKFTHKKMTSAQAKIIKEFASKIPVLELSAKVGVRYRVLQRFCKELGVDYYRKPRLGNTAKQKASDMYAKGVGIDKIAEATGLTANQVAYMVRNLRIKRHEGYKFIGKVEAWVLENKDRLAAMTVSEMAKELGMHRNSIRDYLSNHNIEYKRLATKAGLDLKDAAKTQGLTLRYLKVKVMQGHLKILPNGLIEKCPPKIEADEQGRLLLPLPLFTPAINAGFKTFDELADFDVEKLAKFRSAGKLRAQRMFDEIVKWKANQNPT